jgi:hypothetical protein
MTSFREKHRTVVPAVPAGRQWCAMRFQETILGRLGKALHVRLGEIPDEPLPEQLVELMRNLDEQERKRPEHQPQPEPRTK